MACLRVALAAVALVAVAAAPAWTHQPAAAVGRRLPGGGRFDARLQDIKEVIGPELRRVQDEAAGSGSAKLKAGAAGSQFALAGLTESLTECAQGDCDGGKVAKNAFMLAAQVSIVALPGPLGSLGGLLLGAVGGLLGSLFGEDDAGDEPAVPLTAKQVASIVKEQVRAVLEDFHDTELIERDVPSVAEVWGTRAREASSWAAKTKLTPEQFSDVRQRVRDFTVALNAQREHTLIPAYRRAVGKDGSLRADLKVLATFADPCGCPDTSPEWGPECDAEGAQGTHRRMLQVLKAIELVAAPLGGTLAQVRSVYSAFHGGDSFETDLVYNGFVTAANDFFEMVANWEVYQHEGSCRDSGPFQRCEHEEANYRLAASPGCDSGTLIMSASECQRAYDALASEHGLTNTRGLVQGAWRGVPKGCSVQFRNAHFDQAPHFNTIAEADASNWRLDSGEFLAICLRFNYNLSTEVCTPAAEVTSVSECQMAYDRIALQLGITNKRGMVKGFWRRVPKYCSVQWNNPHYDKAPHFNIIAESNNARLLDGEFRAICREVRRYRLSAATCALGTSVTSAPECQSAFNELAPKHGFAPTRGIQQLDDPHVPQYCSVQVDNAQYDQALHFNGAASDSSRLISGEFLAICRQHGPVSPSEEYAWPFGGAFFATRGLGAGPPTSPVSYSGAVVVSGGCASREDRECRDKVSFPFKGLCGEKVYFRNSAVGCPEARGPGWCPLVQVCSVAQCQERLDEWTAGGRIAKVTADPCGQLSACDNWRTLTGKAQGRLYTPAWCGATGYANPKVSVASAQICVRHEGCVSSACRAAIADDSRW